MKAIEKIIFNELALRKAVVLPSAGTLYVERLNAVISGKEVKAPVNKVVYSQQEFENTPSVVSLMNGLGLERSEAEKAYADWLKGVKTDDGLLIDGVGALRKDFFHPSPELDQILNPTKNIAVVSAPRRENPKPENKRNGRCLTNILLIIIAVLLLAILCLFLCQNSRIFKYCNDEAVAPTHVGTAPSSASAVGISDDGKGEVSVAVPSGKSAHKYYVIAGSFAYDANADKLIRQYAAQFPGIKTEKILHHGGLIMVSVFSTDDLNEADAKRREMSYRFENYELWVYTRK